LTRELVNQLIQIVNEAAELVLDVYRRPFAVDYKAPHDPVTEADRQANTLICERLMDAFPGVPIVAEESAPRTFASFRKAERVFFVDPVDGTRDFVAKNDEFVIMIGLLEEERASAGVIMAPALGRSWFGALGVGAFEVIQRGEEQSVSVTSIGDLSDARVVVSRSQRNAGSAKLVELLGARDVVPMGSAGLKGASVACGEADAYVAPRHGGQRWDACAIDALVHAAGGRLTDARGQLLRYREASLANDHGIVASNPALHAAIVARLFELGDRDG
jgi:3'(2'), 5'-bisphosphate nucleotidase